MLYKLGKKFLNLSADFIHFVQVVLVFMSFFVILYWILQLAEVKFIEPVAPFFESIKAFIHIFYKRIVQMDNVSIDFSFLLAAFLALFISWGLQFVIELIEFAEKKYDNTYNYLKRKNEDSFNKDLEKQYLKEEYKNNKVLILIKFETKNLSKDKFFSRDTEIDVDEVQEEILKEFFDNFVKGLKAEKKLINDGFLLYFNDFDDIEKIISSILSDIKILKKKYIEKELQLNSIMSIDVYADDKEIESKIGKLIILNKLDLKNKIACFATFKQRYSLIKNPKYSVDPHGIYKIFDEESVFFINRLQ